MAKTHRKARQNHIHRNARLGSRRSAVMTFGISRFLCGTPGVLAMAALEVGVDLILEVDHAALFAKSQQLCTLFIDLVKQRCSGFGLDLVAPNDRRFRGSHVSYAHSDGY